MSLALGKVLILKQVLGEVFHDLIISSSSVFMLNALIQALTIAPTENCKRLRTAKVFKKEQNQVGGLRLANIKNYCKTVVIKAM